MPDPTSPLVALSIDSDAIATITLQHGKVNALSVEVLEELKAHAATIASSGARAVIVTGGPKLFAAGADITQFVRDDDASQTSVAGPERVREIGGAFLAALNAIAALPQPTIAEISGFALGGGCELALACDFRIASTRARFGQPEILLGIIPGGGGTQRLARLVGPSIAKDLVFTGRQVDAAEAYRIGLANEVVEPEELAGRTRELAGQLAAGAPNALAIAKRAIDTGLDGTLEAGLELEQDAFVEVFATPDAAVGVTSFLATGPGHADFGEIDRNA